MLGTHPLVVPARGSSKQGREDRHVGGVSEVKFSEFCGTEPAEPVVLAGALVHDCTVPGIYRPNGELWFTPNSFGDESGER